MTKTATTSPTPTPMDVTLAQFSAQIDEHLGREARFEQAIRDYRKNSDLAALWDAHGDARTEIHRMLDVRIDNGTALVAGRRVLAVHQGGGARMVLKADVVKSKRPALWAAARLPQSQLIVKTGLAGKSKAALPLMRTIDETWQAYEHARRLLTSYNSNADKARETIRAVLEAVADTWDAAAEPKITTDGWTLGRRDLLRYNEARCRQLAAAQHLDISALETLVSNAGRRTYVLAEPNYDGAVDLDGD